MQSTKRGFDWLGLIVGIFSIWVGYLIMQNPGSSLKGIAWIVGIFAIVRGLYELWFGTQLNRFLGTGSGYTIFSAIINILVGILFLFNLNIATIVLVYMFAIWFLIDSIIQIFTARLYSFFGKGYYWLVVVLAILSFIFAIILLFYPVLAGGFIVFLLAFFFIATGIAEIIEAF
ncbi:HdeD family acid-resistance protein [Companilactobacillus mishanensis]|uniref:DUF308 domain-containing protein n=1 Tax=Companilactobacillus mishanensis TaxID=2486008 RepID=A0A5P0ZI89_9LACO|nr:DUF308 domain-containing protein [Companilactobacillus mishanensis]MQS46039.1 hypothetical protein [Companilactobacillus mishanensis]MQS52779.1 hypothetical protein [Companilactobacillus mishanensis]